MNTILSLSRQSIGACREALLVVAVVVLASAIVAAQSSVIISEEFTWQSQSVAQHSCKTYKHTISGPGVLTIRTKMSPFRVRDLGMSSEDILTHGIGYFAESLGQTVNGMNGANISEFIGKPIDRISRWKIDAKKYNTEFKVCNPVKCNLAGDCSQQQATASIVVDYAAAGSAPSAISTTSTQTQKSASRSDVTGVWIRTAAGKVIDRMEITVLGDGFKVELRDGEAAPLYASGFGVIQGDRLIVATRNTSNGVSGLLILTFSGGKVHYRSYYLDGRQSWDGDFTKRN